MDTIFDLRNRTGINNRHKRQRQINSVFDAITDNEFRSYFRTNVLLLDEPTAGLDPRTQLWLVELLQELGRSGKTVITATHDLETIEQISKRAVVMGEDHGVKVDGDTVKVLDDMALLLSVNLIHEHMHIHGKTVHEHPHAHGEEKEHHPNI